MKTAVAARPGHRSPSSRTQMSMTTMAMAMAMVRVGG